MIPPLMRKDDTLRDKETRWLIYANELKRKFSTRNSKNSNKTKRKTGIMKGEKL